MARKALSCILVLALFSLTGCWDMLEIEDRGFIIGVSIDLGRKISDKRYEITITDQLAIPSAFGAAAQGGSGDQEAFINITSSGDSILAIDQEMKEQTSKEPFFQHLKVLIISEELARVPHLFENVMDIHIRAAEFRRGMKVLIARDEAKEIMNIKPKDDKLPSMYIDKILEESDSLAEVNKPLSTGEIQELNLKKASYTIPMVYAAKDRVHFDGAAVFHGHQKKMIGTLTSDETFGLNLMTGKNKTGTFDFKYEDEIISIEIERIQNSIKVNPDDIHNIKVNASIELTGNIREVFGHTYPTNQSQIKEIEDAAKKELKKVINKVIKKSQEELQADIFDIDQILYTRHYDTWQKVKDNWDQGKNYYSNATTFNIEPRVVIDHTGTSERTFTESD